MKLAYVEKIGKLVQTPNLILLLQAKLDKLTKAITNSEESVCSGDEATRLKRKYIIITRRDGS